jgi:Flp pilus assembly protein TadD
VNRQKRERQWQSPRDRARVAAELIEEAESLTAHCLIATPAELLQATKPRPIQMPVITPPPPGPDPAPAPAPVASDKPDAEVRTEPVREAAAHATVSDYSAARRDLEQALKRSPDDAGALSALGVMLSRRGLWAEAATQLQRAVEIDAARAEAWCYLGEALNHVDDLSGALAAYTRASELQPANAKAFHGQGIVLDRLNRPEDATRMYRRAREVSRR